MYFVNRIGKRKYLVSMLAAACVFALVHFADMFLAAHNLHAEEVYLDDLLLAAFVFMFVYVLEYAREQELERTRELEQANRELTRQNEAIGQLSGELLRLQDDERRRIARELHDSIGQLLAAVSMKIAAVSSEGMKLSPVAVNALSEIASLTQEISREIRTISHLLHPPLLDEVGLQCALEWYVEGFAERSRIEVSVEVPKDLGRMRREVETTLFRVVQEALTNVHRHSGSHTAAVRISRMNGSIQLEIEDSGNGISEPKLANSLCSGKTGVGIRGMHERIRQLGGAIDIRSSANGTAVRASIPVENEASIA
jgi:two-component system, NarL family, sensor kinase